MNASEIALFTGKEQSLLVETQPKRLGECSEDELADLLARVRRMRDKYSGLHRRQGAATVKAAGKRSATATSNERTLRKVEVLEDTLSRVSLALSRAARKSANDLKQERIATARSEREGSPSRGADKSEQQRRKTAGSKAKTRSRGGKVTQRRAASTQATTARNQAKRDQRR